MTCDVLQTESQLSKIRFTILRNSMCRYHSLVSSLFAHSHLVLTFSEQSVFLPTKHRNIEPHYPSGKDHSLILGRWNGIGYAIVLYITHKSGSGNRLSTFTAVVSIRYSVTCYSPR